MMRSILLSLGFVLLLQCILGIPLIRQGQEFDGQTGLIKQIITKASELLGKNRAVIKCDICVAALDLLRYYVETGVTDDEIVDIITGICVNLDIAVEKVCHGMLEQEIPEIMYVFKDIEFNVSSFSDICGFLFEDDCMVLDEYLAEYDWNVTFPSSEPPYVPPPMPDPDSPKLRILHLSDVHMDPDIAEGAVVNCDEPLCCRPWSKVAKDQNITEYSGKWGGAHGNCDLPQITLENMLEYIVQNIEFDVVYWTGDVPPHDVWNQTKDGNLAIIEKVSGILKQYIPDKPIYPAVGNHESDPVNSFPVPAVYPDYDVSYLYNQLDETWSTLVPDLPDDLVLKGGYFWSQVRPGLRLISLNTNYGHDENVWLLVQSQDPTGQAQWLVDQLEDAEKNNEKVHIIGHIPPGSLVYVWSRNFRDILDRYKGTVSGTFYGHTHNDEFAIIYDDEDITSPIHLSNIGPSATPTGDVNPSFRVYTVDGDYEGSSWAVLDYETYYMDLDQANEDGAPTWKLLYSALDSYGLSSYTPSEWDKFVTRMELNDDLFQLFYGNYHRLSKSDPCHLDCKRDMLCKLRHGWDGYTYPNC